MIHDFHGIEPSFLGDSLFVAPGAAIIGDVTLHEDVSIWFNTSLRGDIESIVIGPGSNIQDGSTVHTDKMNPAIVGRAVTVGHNCVIHGCFIGDESLIGMGAVILSGARIGRNCLVGAGALVTGNTEIPDGMLAVGSPARVVRKLDREQIAGLVDNSRHYVLNKNLYLEMGIGRVEGDARG